MKKYYQLVKEGTSADLYIYGDIAEYDETDVTSFGWPKNLKRWKLKTLIVTSIPTAVP